MGRGTRPHGNGMEDLFGELGRANNSNSSSASLHAARVAIQYSRQGRGGQGEENNLQDNSQCKHLPHK